MNITVIENNDSKFTMDDWQIAECDGADVMCCFAAFTV